MEPNVFWLTKDWKEHWEIADFQGLLAQAQASGTQFTCYDVPSRAFCDEDTLAFGPVGMRCDEETAMLLHDRTALPVPGTHLGLDVEVHWDGAQFWLRPVCPAETLALLDDAPRTETRQELLQVRNTWLPEPAYRALVELANRDEERCHESSGGLPSIPHLEELGMSDSTCPDCGVEPDDLHTFRCDVERCPQCGGQLLSCGCFEDCDDEDAITGRLPWTGEWPGLAECREFGLWCQRNPDGPGWLPCASDVPGATEDLNRLSTACAWDPASRKWVSKDGRRNGSQLPRPHGDRR